jgi:hypothetical protein
MTTKNIDQAEILTDPWGRRSLTVEEWARIHEINDIHAQFGDWVVSSFGLECLTHSYAIPTSRLAESWERQMGIKIWVCLPQLEAALEAARKWHAEARGQLREAVIG